MLLEHLLIILYCKKKKKKKKKKKEKIIVRSIILVNAKSKNKSMVYLHQGTENDTYFYIRTSNYISLYSVAYFYFSSLFFNIFQPKVP